MALNRLQINILLLVLLGACATPSQPLTEMSVTLLLDGESIIEVVPKGSTAREAFESAGVHLDLLDRSEPDLDVTLMNRSQVRLIRVTEEFETEEVPQSFERRLLQSETLPPGELRLVQAGANGLVELTYRLLYEDGVFISRTLLTKKTIMPPREEILMVGIEPLAESFPIPGRLAFLSGGNAWLIEGDSGNRSPLVITGDLDGRIFTLSPDGNWLLFSRQFEKDDSINSLWVANLNLAEPIPLALNVQNVVHFAAWVPGQDHQVAFSTVEPHYGPPGWQARNDLQLLEFDPETGQGRPTTLLSPRADGIYSWWGSAYAYSFDGRLAFSRPDAVGLVDPSSDSLLPLIDLLPYQTESEWAWIPAITWSPDASRLYTVLHAETPGLQPQVRSPRFDLVAIDLGSGELELLADDVGMFAGPAVSPQRAGSPNRIAYLQARNPTQSDVSDYQLVISDEDGANPVVVFPPEKAIGLHPQSLAWSPTPSSDDYAQMIALVYLNNLWLIDAQTGASHQITAGGLVTRFDWVR